MTQLIKNPPAMQETQVQSLGGEDPLERECQPTPVFLPEKPHGQRSLVSYSLWGHKELDITERLSLLDSTEKLGMLQSMGSQRVGHDWAMER